MIASTLSLVVGLVISASATTSSEPEGQQPPIRLLLITLDTLRADRLGAYGYTSGETPALDLLAQTATVFTDVTCSIATTLPSHLTIFTGLTPAQHGVTENGRVPAVDLTSIFDLLGGRGARTAGVISSQILKAKFVAGLGLDELSFGDGSAPEEFQVPGDQVTDRALGWFADHADEPFALWLHYYDPHEPYAPPPAFVERFAGDYQGPLAGPVDEWLPELNDPAFAAELSARDRRHVSDLYDGEVAFLDAQLDRLFRFLRASDLWRKTLILVVADHGQALGENQFWGHGERLLESVVRVPLLIKLPGQTSAHTVDAAVETLDLVPTLADFYGLETPAELTGRSLLDAVRGGAEPADKELRVIERRTYSRTAPARRGIALHGDDWKLTVYRDDDRTRYHLGQGDGVGGLDGEDFFTPEAPQLRLLREIVAAQADRSADQTPFAEDTLKMLRALGYVD